jgi:predicted amidohydrolase
MTEPYTAAVLQTQVRVLRRAEERDSVIKEQLDHILGLLDLKGFMGARPKIVVFPEFTINGVFLDGGKERSHNDWKKISIQIPGDETDKLAKKAVEKDMYIVSHGLEVDDAWPDRFFNTAFLLDSKGKMILRYRKNNCSNLWGFYTVTTPGDVFSEYEKKYGKNTPLGKIGILVCHDIVYPEVARCLTLNGAELLVQPTDEGIQTLMSIRGGVPLRRVRAYENCAYLLTANAGSYIGGLPSQNAAGGSSAINFNGEVMAEIPYPGEAQINFQIDLETLRKKRQMGTNILVNLKPQLYAPVYQNANGIPNDSWLGRPMLDAQEGLVLSTKVAKKMYPSSS